VAREPGWNEGVLLEYDPAGGYCERQVENERHVLVGLFLSARGCRVRGRGRVEAVSRATCAGIRQLLSVARELAAETLISIVN
jgi:hypothetical protein